MLVKDGGTQICTDTSDGSGNWSCESSAMSDGAHSITASVEAFTSSTLSITIDTAAPTISLASPADGAYTTDNTPASTGTAGISGGDSGTVTIKVYSGGGTSGTPSQTLTASREATTGAYSVDASTLSDGTYTAQALQKDTADNTGTSSAHTFTVDTTNPVVSITSQPDLLALGTSALFGFTASDPNLNSVECKLDSGGFSACDSGTSQSYSNVSQGEHTFTVKATDDAGNYETDSYTWRVDTAPTLSDLASGTDYPASIPWGNEVGFTASAADPDTVSPYNDTISYSLSGTIPSGASIDPSTGEFSWVPQSGQIGNHTFSVVATDSLGRTDAQTVAVEVTRRPVIVTYSGDTSGQYSDRVSLCATLTDTGTGDPISGQTITFTIGTQSTTGITDTNGVVSASIKLDQPAATTTVVTSFDGNSVLSDTSDSVVFTINREDTGVRSAQSNPKAVQVTRKGTAPQMTFTARIREVTDYSYGDISKIEQVRYTLAPVGGGTSYNCLAAVSRIIPATETDPGFIDTACTFPSGVKIDVYDVIVSVGGNYYGGAGHSVLTVYDPAAGGSNGAGTITDPATGNSADFAYMAAYVTNGGAKGKMIYVETNADGGQMILKGNVMSTLAISGNTAKITGKATLDGVGNYSYVLTGVDNATTTNPNPAISPDKYGQRVTDSSGTQVANLSFDPSSVETGNVFVGK